MRRALTAAQMQAVDSSSMQLGMPAALLMENAGEALMRAALRESSEAGRFFILCGPGNNGGDGLVAARKLVGLGRHVFIELVGDKTALKGECARNFEALRSSGLTAEPISNDSNPRAGDVVVDALLGTGLNRAPDNRIAEAIERIAAWRAAGARVVAADLPSGLDSDSGKAHSPCVTADVTTSFGYVKVGQLIEPGANRCGVVEVVDIGIPVAAQRALSAPATFLLEESDVRPLIPKRTADSHKGTYGHVLIVGGSWGKTGAGALAALGALRGGAGLVTIAARPEALIPMMQHAPEIMGVELINDGPLGPEDLRALLDAAKDKTAVVFGPAIERGDTTHKLLAGFLEGLNCPCVLDADGLNALAGHLDILRLAKSGLILTPHPGEMARLLQCSTAEVQADRIGRARTFAKEHGLVLVLKGTRSLVAHPDGTVFINPTGNAGMATGGTGDVLAGLCGALLAQGLTAEDAALAATWVHGMAGDVAKEHRGEMGLIASDVIEGLGEVWRRWSR